MKKFLTCAGVSVLSLAAAQPFTANAQSAAPTGYYCESSTYVLKMSEEYCEHLVQKGEMQEGEKCPDSFTAEDILGLEQTMDGDLDFFITLWFDHGHRCDLEGTAEWVGDNEWLFQDPALVEGDPSTACALSITYSESEGVRLFTRNENADCKAACGARGRFDNVHFIPGTKVLSRLPEDANTKNYCLKPPVEDVGEKRKVTK